MLYLGKHYHERSKEILLDNLKRGAYQLRLYTGTFPTQADIDSTDCRMVNTLVSSNWNNVAQYRKDIYNDGIVELAGWTGKIVAQTNMSYDDIKITEDGIYYAMNTYRSLTASVNGPINFFELVPVNGTGSVYTSSNTTGTSCYSSGANVNTTLSLYGSVYGIVGEVGTNNNLTVSKQNVVAGEQFYLHDLWFRYNIDADAIKAANPTLL